MLFEVTALFESIDGEIVVGPLSAAHDLLAVPGRLVGRDDEHVVALGPRICVCMYVYVYIYIYITTL